MFHKNTELTDLRKIVCLREFLFIKSLKIWWSMANKVSESLVEHGRQSLKIWLSIALLQQIFNDYTVCQQLRHGSVTIATTDLSNALLNLLAE